MELRSGHRLNPPPPSLPCRRRRFRSEGGRVDRISDLPDDLLLQVYALDVKRNFGQEITSLPNFSVLQLSLVTWGHIFGPLLLNLLGICTVIQKLEVSLDKVMFRQVCPSNCPCEQTQNWRSEIISLAALEEVEIEGFEGTGDAIDILKLLFRCTPLMKTMASTLTPEVLPTSRGCKKTYRILRENPSVKCRVYCSGGEEVLYP